MSIDGERASIVSMNGGDIAARLDDEIEKLIKNIMDPATDAEEKRVLYMTLTLQADTGRAVVRAIPKFKVKLSSAGVESTTLYVNLRTNGELVVTELNPKQSEMFAEAPVQRPRIIPGGEREKG